ncbi:MAG: DUF4244 domain-containing protein [Actinobacteria bacterium]|nr:DUF4244 domain-containing protein [Actinomycetota bacterium]
MLALWQRWLESGHRDERGQGTVEYFLVILAATALAVILFKWVQSSGGTSIIDTILGKVVGWVSSQF